MKRIDPVLLLLMFGLIFFTGILIFVEHFFPSDGQVFQVVSGVLTAFSGAFFMRVKPQTPQEEKSPDSKLTETQVTKIESPIDPNTAAQGPKEHE